MKEIRQITDVVPSEFGDENNNDNKVSPLEEFDGEPGYYQQVIRPMFMAGHENELVYWLRSLGFIPNVQTCKNSKSDEICDKVMNWTPARTQDLYQWKCNECKCKRNIRDDSVFAEFKCTFKNVIRIWLGWTKGIDVESMAELLGVKKAVVNAIYLKTGLIAEKYIRSHIHDWQLGGHGSIVLVDTYPEGCGNKNIETRPTIRPILCLTEVKSMPQKYWLEVMERIVRNNYNHTEVVKSQILSSIQEIVLPGTILVVPLNSHLCSYNDLQQLNNLYTIISIDGIARHNTETQNVFNNLETIWKNILPVCEEAQLLNHQLMQQYLMSQMWRNRFGHDSFECLLYQMSYTTVQ